jgi:hypothetical protein
MAPLLAIPVSLWAISRPILSLSLLSLLYPLRWLFLSSNPFQRYTVTFACFVPFNRSRDTYINLSVICGHAVLWMDAVRFVLMLVYCFMPRLLPLPAPCSPLLRAPTETAGALNVPHPIDGAARTDRIHLHWIW